MKKKSLKRMLLSMGLATGLVLGLNTIVLAETADSGYVEEQQGANYYVDAPSNIRQTDVKSSSVTIAWDASPTATAYEVQLRGYSQGYDSYRTMATVSETSVTLNGLSSNSKYYVRVCGTNPSYKYPSGYITTSDPVKTLPGKVAFKSSSASSYSQKYNYYFKTDTDASIDGYQIKYTNLGTKKYKTIYSSKYSCEIPVSKKAFYKIEMRAYTNVNSKYYYGAKRTLYAAQQPELAKKSSTRSSMTIKWPAVKGASNYSVYISTKNDSGFKKVKTTTATSYKKTGMKKGKAYYIKVVANKKVGKTTYKSPSKAVYFMKIY